MSGEKKNIYVDLYLGILALIFLIVYISMISVNSYINKNSPEWANATIEQKKFVGYTNMVGNLFAIVTFGFDTVIFKNPDKITIDKYIIKLVILLIFIALSYDVAVHNNSYGKFISALQPLVGYLQVISIATIVQIITKIDRSTHRNGEYSEVGIIERYVESPVNDESSTNESPTDELDSSDLSPKL